MTPVANPGVIFCGRKTQDARSRRGSRFGPYWPYIVVYAPRI